MVGRDDICPLDSAIFSACTMYDAPTEPAAPTTITVEESAEPVLEPEPFQLRIEDFLFIGDSNTVVMKQNNPAMHDAKAVAAVVGEGVTSMRDIYTKLDALDDPCFDNVVIMLGTNDWYQPTSKVHECYTALLNYIKGRSTAANIYIVTIPPVYNGASTTIKDSDASRINDMLVESFSGEYTIVDLYNYLTTDDMSHASNNGYHLTTDGSIRAFNYILQEITG